MQSQRVVIPVDEFFDVRSQMIEIVIVIDLNLFAFEGLEEAFATRIVIGIGGPAHAGNNLCFPRILTYSPEA